MSYSDSQTPTGLNKPDEEHISIDWADGETSVLAMNLLRAKCPCASCVDEWTGELKVKPQEVEHVRVKNIAQVGNYAFSITFSDGHNTGIFTYQSLRALSDG